ncbi:MAG: hypothetical protein RL430_1918, partial [Actinomycetota bacterium]
DTRVTRVDQRLCTTDVGGGDDGHAGVDQLGQVRLVGVPPDDVCIVEQTRRAGDGIQPREELVVPAVVIPRGTNNRRIEPFPVRCGGVPIDDLAVDAERTQRLRDQRQVGVVLALTRATRGTARTEV